MTTIKTILHKGKLVQAIENTYQDGRVTQRILNTSGIPVELKVIYIGRGRVGKIFNDLHNQEYLQYMYHMYNN